MIRKYGDRVSIRGAIKEITTTGTDICTLNDIYKPNMNHVYMSCAVSNGQITSNVMLQILSSTGQVKLLAKSGNIGTNDMLPINSDFLVS